MENHTQAQQHVLPSAITIGDYVAFTLPNVLLLLFVVNLFF